MITFYYLNRETVESQYAQIRDRIEVSREAWSSTSNKAQGKLSLALEWLGLAGPEASVERMKSAGEKTVLGIPHEQKLVAVWRHLRDQNELAILTGQLRANLALGRLLVFEGKFSLHDRSEEIAHLEGAIDGSLVSVSFSKGHMPPSVLASLSYSPEDVPLSGCGLIMKMSGPQITIRPVAFGLNFLEALMGR